MHEVMILYEMVAVKYVQYTTFDYYMAIDIVHILSSANTVSDDYLVCTFRQALFLINL